MKTFRLISKLITPAILCAAAASAILAAVNGHWGAAIISAVGGGILLVLYARDPHAFDISEKIG